MLKWNLNNTKSANVSRRQCLHLASQRWMEDGGDKAHRRWRCSSNRQGGDTMTWWKNWQQQGEVNRRKEWQDRGEWRDWKPQCRSCGGVFLEAKPETDLGYCAEINAHPPTFHPSPKSPVRPRHWYMFVSRGDLIWDKEAYRTNKVSHPHPFIRFVSFCIQLSFDFTSST